MFARTQVDAALADHEYAIFLVHTRLPSARLDQAQCEEFGNTTGVSTAFEITQVLPSA